MIIFICEGRAKQMENEYYGYVYRITNNDNGKIYIGQKKAIKLVEDYWGSGLYITRAIKKYGLDNFSRDILEWCNSKEHLNEREIFWIGTLNSTNPNIGYNISTGGNGGNLGEAVIQKMANSMKGKRHSEATKQKMSASRMNHSISAETKRKISDANKGENCYWYGKHHSEDTRHKMSQSHRGHVTSEETRIKISKSNTGKVRSAEAILKNSLAHRGDKHPNWNKHLSEETKRKIGNAHRGRKMSYEQREQLKHSFKNRVYHNKCKVCGNIFEALSANNKTCNDCRYSGDE